MPLRPVFSPVALTLAVLSGLVAAPAAEASFAGRNGPILFSQYTAKAFPGEPNEFEISGDLRTVSPDGTGNRALTATGDVSESAASPSPDGRRLVYVRGQSLWTSSIDGADAMQLVEPSFYADMPAWSPDGRTVVFAGSETGIHAVGVDATGHAVAPPRRLLSTRPYREGAREVIGFGDPQYTPDGTSLRFARLRFKIAKRITVTSSIWKSGADGSNAGRVFRGSGESRATANLDLSPDGTRIAYLATPNANKEPRRVFVANADGSGERLLSVAPVGRTFDDVAWSPDGTSLVVSESRTRLTDGAELLVLDAATGVRRTVARSENGPIHEVSWAPQPVD